MSRKRPDIPDALLAGAKVTRINVEALGGVPAETPLRSKYGNVRTEYAGQVYDSKAEAARAQQLDLLRRANKVWCWYRQPVFLLGCPENKFVGDFLVIGEEGIHAEDVKGFRTPKFRRDLKLWRAYGPVDLWVIQPKETLIIPGGRARRS